MTANLLIFAKASKYHMESQCKRYTVDGSRNHLGLRYLAWFRADKTPEILGVERKPHLAIELCEAHARARLGEEGKAP